MEDLEQLKQQDSSVISLFDKLAPYGAKLDVVELEGDKLHLKGKVPSTVVANHVWDLIKKADPAYADLHHEIATTGGAEQEYTVKPGDTLSAVCLLFYGNANKYQKWRRQMESIPTRSPWARPYGFPCCRNPIAWSP